MRDAVSALGPAIDTNENMAREIPKECSFARGRRRFPVGLGILGAEICADSTPETEVHTSKASGNTPHAACSIATFSMVFNHVIFLLGHSITYSILFYSILSYYTILHYSTLHSNILYHIMIIYYIKLYSII